MILTFSSLWNNSNNNSNKRGPLVVVEAAVLQLLLLSLVVFLLQQKQVVGFSFGVSYSLQSTILLSEGPPSISRRRRRRRGSLHHRHHHYYSKTNLHLLRMRDTDDNDGVDDNDDDDDDDFDDIPEIDIRNFKPPGSSNSGGVIPSFGLNRGRSSPLTRKAMGTSSASQTTVHVCSNCGTESVQWLGRCPTCKQWNTLQEISVRREKSSSSSGRGGSDDIFSSFQQQQQKQRQQRKQRSESSSSSSSSPPSSSWVSGITTTTTSNYRNSDDDDDDFFFNQPIQITKVFDDNNHRYKNQRISIPDDQELTTVMGGGIMKGSLTLLGGSPGVGKSTLLLQIAASVASSATITTTESSLPSSKRRQQQQQQQQQQQDLMGPVWYVSGEETAEQIASRAKRLQIEENELWLLSETHVDSLVEQVITLIQQQQQEEEATATSTTEITTKGVRNRRPPSLLLIDSIQTMTCDAGGTNSAAGGVTQMRECVALFLKLAKSTGIPIILIGHVTKTGGVAGPRTIEHMVDCVLYLEGVGGGTGSSSDIIMNLRMLRASKNRFGSSDEVGVYEMGSGRLLPVSDPSSLLMSHRLNTDDTEGCAITVALEGIRPMTVEIQALVTPSTGGPTVPSKRTVTGIAYSRAALLLGVLQKRASLVFGRQDIYINVVGSVRLDKNRGEGGSSSDLAVVMALVSSLMSIPVRSDTAFVGEVGLLGELRPVAAIEKRVQEARRMGFSRIVTPVSSSTTTRRKGYKKGSCLITREHGIERVQCDTLLAAINAGLTESLPKQRSRRLGGTRTTTSPKKDDVTTSTTRKARRPTSGSTRQEAIMDDYDEYDDSESNVLERIMIVPPVQGKSIPSKPAPGSLQDLNLDDDDDDTYMGDDDSNYYYNSDEEGETEEDSGGSVFL